MIFFMDIYAIVRPHSYTSQYVIIIARPKYSWLHPFTAQCQQSRCGLGNNVSSISLDSSNIQHPVFIHNIVPETGVIHPDIFDISFPYTLGGGRTEATD
jgi:hypothetical protein